MSSRSHGRRASVQMGEREVVRMSQIVRAKFARRASPGDLDDVQQDAALEILETLQRGNVDPEGNPGAYLHSAGMRGAAAGLLRALSAVSITRYAFKRARAYQVRVPIDGCGYFATEGETSVATLCAPDCEPPRAYIEIRALVAEHLPALARDERTAVSMLLGIGMPAAANAREVEWRARVGQARTRAALAKLQARLESDHRWHTVIEQREDRP